MVMRVKLLWLCICAVFLPGCVAQQIAGFTLIDTNTMQPLFPVSEGSIIDIRTTGTDLTIQVQIDTEEGVQSVNMMFGVSMRNDFSAPYAIGGDLASPVASLATVKAHTLTAQIIAPSLAILDEETITFQVIDGTTSTPTASPVQVGTPSDVPAYPFSNEGTVSGEFKKWHKITIGFTGPLTSETADLRPSVDNAFADYRLDVTFTNGDTTYVVPGYYAADGNAANSVDSTGSVWLVHFSPDLEGEWSWVASFTNSFREAIEDTAVGTPISFDGASGSFVVGPTDKTGRDLRGKGRLQYVGKHHYQFAETKEWFLKAGADSPENLLAYADFDDTPDEGFLKTWEPHVQDYNEGDPTWSNGKGKGLIGAINYLSEKGMNAFSFLPLNIGGDDKSVFPYISNSTSDLLRFDVSKLAQWEVIFEHADKKGMFLHFKTQETEMENLLDGGELGEQRRMYYRELIARFGHHLALNWNLGEESRTTDARRKSYAEYIRRVDPYNSPIVVHTLPNQKRRVYTPLLGFADFEGPSLQSNFAQVYSDTLRWRDESGAAGRPWVVCNDEQGPFQRGVLPDVDEPGQDRIRQNVLWGNFMAGGAGVEYYFGYEFPNSDLTLQDFRSRDQLWDQSRHALEFFNDNKVPFWDMRSRSDLVTGDNWALAMDNLSSVVVYFRSGTNTTVDLSAAPPRPIYAYKVDWYNPRQGGNVFPDPNTPMLTSDTSVQLQRPQGSPGTEDWTILIRSSIIPRKTRPTERDKDDDKLFEEDDTRGTLTRRRHLTRGG